MCVYFKNRLFICIKKCQENNGIKIDKFVNLEKDYLIKYNKINEKKRNFIVAMEKNGENIYPTIEPRIKLSSIHGAKGDERQNTVLMLDIDYNSYNAYQKDPNPEHRLFFVGITRTVENLYLVNPMGEYGYQI